MTIEQLFAPVLRGPLSTIAASKSNQWAGTVSIASGSATGVVSTTAVKSDSLIFLQPKAATRTASGFPRHFEVSTVVDGGYFEVAVADGVAVPRDTTVMFNLINL